MSMQRALQEPFIEVVGAKNFLLDLFFSASSRPVAAS